MPVHDLTGAGAAQSPVVSPAHLTSGQSGQVQLFPLEDLADRISSPSEALGPVGVVIEPDTDLDAVAPYLDRLAVIAVNFPVFKDGRGFSQARVLRDRYGYTGDVRAVGDLLLDQLQFLIRVGFSSVDLPDDVTEADVKAAVERFTVVYQTAADSRRPIQQVRQAETGAQ